MSLIIESTFFYLTILLYFFLIQTINATYLLVNEPIGEKNIILKKNIGFTANLTGGTTTHGDGQTGDLNLNYGTALGKDKGFLNLSFQTKNSQIPHPPKQTP